MEEFCAHLFNEENEILKVLYISLNKHVLRKHDAFWGVDIFWTSLANTSGTNALYIKLFSTRYNQIYFFYDSNHPITKKLGKSLQGSLIFFQNRIFITWKWLSLIITTTMENKQHCPPIYRRCSAHMSANISPNL